MPQQPKVLVTGGGGFIGHHLINYLIDRGYWVRGVDIKTPEFDSTRADEFLLLDLTVPENCLRATHEIDEVYGLAANMGGIGFIVAGIAGKKIRKRYDVTKPQGVRGRNSDNTRLREVLNWEPSISLEEGLARTYHWIASQLAKDHEEAQKAAVTCNHA